jgi:cellulose 1,4-beta-cellobiosidase
MGHARRRLHRKILTVLMAAALAAAGLVLGTSLRADAAVTCEVTYTTNTWGSGSGGFTASIAIKNTGDPLSNWTLTFTFPGSQQITQGWSANWTQSGPRVTARNPAWGGTIATGGSFIIGFNGSWTGSNPPPTDFAINGVPCRVILIPSPTPTVSPSPSSSPTPPPLRILVTPSTLTVPEGGQASVQMRLSQRPTRDIIVGTARVQGDTDLAGSGPLTFTPDNWDTPQHFVVTAAEDADTTNGQATFDSRSSQITGSSAFLWTAIEQDNDTPGPTASPDVPVDNPFAGVTGYVNPDWVASVEGSAVTAGGAAAERMRRLKTVPTAIWLDRIAKVTGGAGVTRGLEAHLDAALAQNAGYVTLVLYNLPDKDCLSLVSGAELHAAYDGLNRYKTEYIDAITAIISQAKYARLRIATVIEPRSLTALITGIHAESCRQVMAASAYVSGIRYALDRFSPLPNVYTYLDAGHSGWIGWESNFGALADLITTTVRGTASGVSSVDGIATNVAEYVPTEEPFLPDSSLVVGGSPLRSSTFFEWNPYFDERDYATAMRDALVQRGLSSSVGAVIDTSRNGWGGADRPASVSTSGDLNTYADESRLDRRPYRFSWCNQKGAGVGARPVAHPFPGVDALLWVKPPGESDGPGGPLLPPESDRLFDRMCDPSATNRFKPTVSTNAMPDAPLFGVWHHDQFAMLVNNAYPVP